MASPFRTEGRLAPKATILLAEDEPQLRELGETILTRAGYKVITGSTSEALKALVHEYREGVDLLLTDIFMPGVGGIELVRMAKARWPAICVLYVSGYSGDQIKGLEPDAAFLQKPFTPVELLSKIAELLARPSSPP